MAVRELSSLDDWILLELLDRVPLGSLFCMGRVNRRFKGLVERNLLGRRQLGLIIGYGYDCTPEFDFNSITVMELDRLAVERILELLPGITSLEITNNCDSIEVLDELLYLFEGWVDQLESLDWSLMEEIEPPYNVLPLFGLINRMRQLKKLRILHYGNLADTYWTAIHLPVIGQLQELYISIRNDGRPMLRQLRTYATDQLTEVNLWCPFEDPESTNLILNVEPHLANRFSSLYLLTRDFSFDQLATIYQMYTSLRIAAISLHLLTVGQLNRTMAMLPQLTIVCLYCNFPDRSAARQSEDAPIILGEEVEPDTVDGSQLVPLHSVTNLKLVLTLSSHADFEMLHLKVLYPKLVKLQFDYLACLTCGYHFDDDDLEASRRCLLQLQSKSSFSQMFLELQQVTCKGETLAEEDWHPEPSMPRPLFYFVVTFFGVIICRQVGRQLIGAASGQVIAKTASQGVLAVVTMAFKLARSSMQSIIGIARK